MNPSSSMPHLFRVSAETPIPAHWKLFRHTGPLCQESKIGCFVRRRVASHHHDGTINTSATKNPTKGGDSLKCNLASANKIKKLNWFASLAVK